MKKFLSLFITLAMLVSMFTAFTAEASLTKETVINCENSVGFAGQTVITDPKNAENSVTQVSLTESATNCVQSLAGVNGLTAIEISFDIYLPAKASVWKTAYMRINSNLSGSWFNLIWFRNGYLQFATDGPTADITPKTWYTVKAVVDADSKVVNYYFGTKGNVKFIGFVDISRETIMSDLTKKYNNCQVVRGNADLEFYIDNFKSSIYEEPFTAFNKCNIASDAKAQIELYEALGLFDGGEKRTLIESDALYESLIGKSFTSNDAAQKAYDAVYDAMAFGDGSKLYYMWDFEDGTLNDISGTTGFMSENPNAINYSLATDPNGASNYVIMFGNTGLGEYLNYVNGNGSMRDDIESKAIRYAVLDMDLYKKAPEGSNARNYLRLSTGSSTARVSLWETGDSMYNIFESKYAYLTDINNKWVSIRTVIDFETGDYASFVLDDGEYKLCRNDNSKYLTYAYIGGESDDSNALQRISIGFSPKDNDDWEAIYFDNISYRGYEDYYKVMNNAPMSSVDEVAYAFDMANIIDLPYALFDMTDEQKNEFFASVKGNGSFESDSEVSERMSAYVTDMFANGDDLYLYDYTEADGELRDLIISVNKEGITDENTCAIVALYDENSLVDVTFSNFNGSLSKYTTIPLKGLRMDNSEASTIKIMLWNNINSCIPIAKNIVKKNSMRLQGIYYPEWTKKAVTFTFDDANMEKDAQMIEILKENNLKATFNLVTSNMMSSAKDGYTESEIQAARELYSGFEVMNHTKYHPYPAAIYSIDELTVFAGYDEDGNEIDMFKRSSGYAADEEAYIKCVDAGRTEIEEIFGEGSVRGFVWPGGGAKSYLKLTDYVEDTYEMIRDTSNKIKDATFSLPDSWKAWSYNANYTNILSRAQAYDALETEDLQPLTWLCTGVHSLDFFRNEYIEQYDSHNALKSAVALLANRPETYWYASVGEIYDYTEALKNLIIGDGYITNGSSLSLYLKVNGNFVVIEPGETLR